jgi:hypothetical protein
MTKTKRHPKEMYRYDKQIAIRITLSDYAFLEYAAELFGSSLASVSRRYLERGITAELSQQIDPRLRDGYNKCHTDIWGQEASLEGWFRWIDTDDPLAHWTDIDPGMVMGHEEAKAAGMYSSSTPPPEDGIIEMDDGSIIYRKDHPYTKQQKVILKKELQTLRKQIGEMGERIEELELQVVDQEE